VAEQGEARSSVHLPLDHLGLNVDAFGPAVVIPQGECRRGCLDVEVEAPGGGVQMR
jgi:hypothetical protein